MGGGGKGSMGGSMSAEKAKATKEAAEKKSMAATKQRRRSSVYEDKDKSGRKDSAGGKGSFGTGRRKSKDMSKESKMKQKKADEAALRKNKVIYDKYLAIW